VTVEYQVVVWLSCRLMTHLMEPVIMLTVTISCDLTDLL